MLFAAALLRRVRCVEAQQALSGATARTGSWSNSALLRKSCIKKTTIFFFVFFCFFFFFFFFLDVCFRYLAYALCRGSSETRQVCGSTASTVWCDSPDGFLVLFCPAAQK